MCGLIGLVHRDAGRSPDVRALSPLLRHRGPDAEGFCQSIDGAVQLGFRRLAIIDLSTGDQPVFNEDRSVAVVLNGEIYNYIELTRELEARGHRFRSHGDAEVLVHLYEEHGDALVDRLQGMFAFALWDESKRRLLLARDHAGIKPVYYVSTPALVGFASEIKPLLRLPGVSRDFSSRALHDYLSFGYTLAPHTIFRDVRKLPAGHLLVIANGELEEKAFWDCAVPRSFDGSDAELDCALLASFDESIRLHLRSDVAVGAFLSGGIDSGLMVARAADLHPRLRTYTLRFEGGDRDESALAQSVADRYGTDHKTFTVRADHLDALLPRMVWACDEPLGDSGLLPNYLISELAARDGVKVVLNGAGGDELFAGYPYYFPTTLEESLLRRPVATAVASALAAPVVPEVARKLDRALAYESDTGAHYLGHVTVWPEREIARLVDPAHAERANPERLGYFRRFNGDPLNAKLYADIKTYLTDDLMLLLDRMTMIHSLEGRVPFLHRPFMELAMGVDGARKAVGGRKALLKRIAEPWLPPALLTAPKSGFSSPINMWVGGRLGAQMIELLSEPRSVSRPWWNPKAFQEFVRSSDAQGRLHHRLFLLFVLEVFARVHVDASYDAPPSVRLPDL